MGRILLTLIAPTLFVLVSLFSDGSRADAQQSSQYTATFDYTKGQASADDLNNRISQEMTAGISVIKIELVPGVTAMPDYLQAWLAQIHNTGGQVMQRQTTMGFLDDMLSALATAFINVIGQVIQSATAWVESKLGGLQNPASNYNAIVVLDQTAGANTKTCFIAVEFYRRNSAEWAAAAKLATAIDLSTLPTNLVASLQSCQGVTQH